MHSLPTQSQMALESLVHATATPLPTSGRVQPPGPSQAVSCREGPEVDGGSIPQSRASGGLDLGKANPSFSAKTGGLQPPILVPRMGGCGPIEETFATVGQVGVPLGSHSQEGVETAPYVYPNLATFEALRLGTPLPHSQGAASEDTPPGPFPFNHAADLREVMHRDHGLGVGTPVEGPILPDPVGRIAQPGIDTPTEGTIPAAPV